MGPSTSSLPSRATATCVAAERKLVQSLQGDCHSPIAALATVERHGPKPDAIVRSLAELPGLVGKA